MENEELKIGDGEPGAGNGEPGTGAAQDGELSEEQMEAIFNEEDGAGNGEDNPDNPDNGGGEDNPDNPDNGGGKDNPDNPDNGGGEDNPDNPDNGGGEDNPDNPDNGGGEDNPDNPGNGGGENNPDNRPAKTTDGQPDDKPPKPTSRPQDDQTSRPSDQPSDYAADIEGRVDAVLEKGGAMVVGKDESGKDVTLADMQRDYPTVTGAIAAIVKAALKDVVSPLGEKVAEASARAGEVYEAARSRSMADAREANIDALEKKVPGARAALGGKAFAEWFSKQSKAVKALAGAGSTPEDHVFFINAFKAEHPEAFARAAAPVKKVATSVARIISRSAGTRARTGGEGVMREMTDAEMEAEFNK